MYAWDACTGSAEVQHRSGQQSLLVFGVNLSDAARHKLMEPDWRVYNAAQGTVSVLRHACTMDG